MTGRARSDNSGWPRYVRVETLIFLGFLLWFMFEGRSRYFNDTGTLWHPVVGDEILTTGRFPTVDRFSFTHAGKPWIAWHWLGEIVLAIIKRLGGLDVQLLATATLLAAFYAWAVHRLMASGVPWWFALLLTAFAIKASSYHFYARPHMATIVLMGWIVAQLCDFEAGRIPLRQLWWFVPVFVVWANIHGGVLGGIGTLAVAICGWTLAKVVGLPTPIARYRQLLPLGLLALACSLATLVNPYGLDLPRTWWTVMGSTVVHERIIEHNPLLRSPFAWTVVAFAAVYAAMMVSVPLCSLRVTWLLPLVWFCLAWSRIRNGPLFASVAIVALAELLPAVRWSSALYGWGNRLLPQFGNASDILGWRSAVVPAATVVTAGVLLRLGHWAQLDPNVWPVQLLPELRTYDSNRPPGTPFFNDMNFGGFLIAHTPNLRVFIDDRCELYGDAGIMAYDQAHRKDPSQVDRWAEQYGFDRALVVRASSIDQYLRESDGWRVVAECQAATLHERVSGSP